MSNQSQQSLPVRILKRVGYIISRPFVWLFKISGKVLEGILDGVFDAFT
jgi:hypothetical protein